MLKFDTHTCTAQQYTDSILVIRHDAAKWATAALYSALGSYIQSILLGP